jgi:hypothetical protein
MSQPSAFQNKSFVKCFRIVMVIYTCALAFVLALRNQGGKMSFLLKDAQERSSY